MNVDTQVTHGPTSSMHRPKPNSDQNVGLSLAKVTDGHSSTATTSKEFNSSTASGTNVKVPFETILTSVQVVNTGMDSLGMTEANVFKSPSKPLGTRMRKRYRLIKKSPLKGSPIKNLNNIFRKRRRKTKTKGLSPRKLQFILPKITKFSPKKVKYPRSFTGKSKLLPIIPRTESSSTFASSNIIQHQPPAVSGSNIRELSSKATESADQENTSTVSENNSLHPKEQNVDAKEKSSTRILEDIIEEDEDDDVEEVDQQQQEEHLAAFLKASSTIASQRAYEPREQRQQRRLQDKISSLAYIPDLKSQQDVLVLNYLLQVKEALIDTKFDQFIDLLNGIRLNSDPVEEVYHKIMEVLKGLPDLQEFFVAFLRPDQAMRVGKYAEFCLIERMREFVDEFKYHFSKQPQNMQKVRRTLYSLLSQEQINVDEIISALKPLLKLQPWLIESLLQCMPVAKPRQSVPEDFEEINMDCPNSPGDDFEDINMVGEETKATNTDSCSCECHHINLHANSTDVPGASPPQTYKPEHCISCGLRFIDGRVYVRFGKALRLASVIYLSENHESNVVTEGSNSSGNVKGKEDRTKITSNKQAKLCHNKFTTEADSEKPKKGRKTKKS